MPIKLIAIDLDGTLLDSERRVQARSAAAIRKANELGIAIVFASGRTVGSIRPFAQEVGVAGAIVGCNGGYVVDETGAEIHHFALKPTARNQILDYVELKEVAMVAYLRDEVWDLSDSKWIELYRKRVRNMNPKRATTDRMRSTDPTKLLLIDSPDQIERHVADLASSVDKADADWTISEPEYLEFLAPGIDKVIGIRAIATRMGISQEEVAAIGDWHNDLEMIRWAGYSGAMGNAVEEVKQAATRVFSTNVEGGVSDFIDSIVHNQ